MKSILIILTNVVFACVCFQALAKAPQDQLQSFELGDQRIKLLVSEKGGVFVETNSGGNNSKTEIGFEPEVSIAEIKAIKWKSGLFAVAKGKLNNQWAYFGIALNELTPLNKEELKVGLLFQCDSELDIRGLSNPSGDTIHCMFLRRLKMTDKKLTGVYFVNHCPEIASPGKLFRISGEQIFDEQDEILKNGITEITPPFISFKNDAEINCGDKR